MTRIWPPARKRRKKAGAERRKGGDPPLSRRADYRQTRNPLHSEDAPEALTLILNLDMGYPSEPILSRIRERIWIGSGRHPLIRRRKCMSFLPIGVRKREKTEKADWKVCIPKTDRTVRAGPWGSMAPGERIMRTATGIGMTGNQAEQKPACMSFLPANQMPEEGTGSMVRMKNGNGAWKKRPGKRHFSRS